MPISVSVVIPTYNRPEAVRRAVLSVLAQSFAPYEIIVVDDASEPPLRMDELGCSDPRIKLVRLDDNRGAAAARQAGVDAAAGEVIAFLDSDDVWMPGKLAAQLAHLAAPLRAGKLVAVACGWETAPEDGRRPVRCLPLPGGDVVKHASGCWFNPGTTVILPKRAFDVVGPFNPNLRRLEDLDWFLRFALAGGRLEVAPIIGAVISTGRRGRLRPVSEASREIRARFSGTARAELTLAAQRRLSAYLDLEQAAAARNQGYYVAMLWFLLRSFAKVPRTSLHLGRWWQRHALTCSGG